MSACVVAAVLGWALAALAADPAASDSSNVPNRLSQADREAGWVLLFDGKSTDEWRGFGRTAFPTEGWKVEDGCLQHAEGLRGGDIITTNTFTNFELRFDWKIGLGANSGVKYFILESRGSPIGHEYQVIDDERHPDGKRGPKWQTGGFYDVLPPSATRPKPPGQFNESRIVVRGNSVEHWLNGARVLAYELGSDQLRAAIAVSKFRDVQGFGTAVTGHILLQDHGDAVWFRNIKIRTIPVP